MARNKGTFPFAANFEVKAASPLDPRVLVEKKSELISKDTWPLDGDTLYIYKGLLVSVQKENAVYMLIDDTKILEEDFSGWKRIDGSQGEPTVIPQESTYLIEDFTILDIDEKVSDEGTLKISFNLLKEAIKNNKIILIKKDYMNSVILCNCYEVETDEEPYYIIETLCNNYLYKIKILDDTIYTSDIEIIEIGSNNGGVDTYVLEFSIEDLLGLASGNIDSLAFNINNLRQAVIDNKVVLINYYNTHGEAAILCTCYNEDTDAEFRIEILLEKKIITITIDLIDLEGDVVTIYTKDITITELQEKLKSGENIKTINGESVLGEGDIKISTSTILDFTVEDVYHAHQEDTDLLGIETKSIVTDIDNKEQIYIHYDEQKQGIIPCGTYRGDEDYYYILFIADNNVFKLHIVDGDTTVYIDSIINLEDIKVEIEVDSQLSDVSTNPVQNKAITEELNKKANTNAIPTRLLQLTNDADYATTTYVDGKIPTKTSELNNNSGFITANAVQENYQPKGEYLTETELTEKGYIKDVDDELSDTSENPVQNKVITTELKKKANTKDIPTKVSELDNNLDFVTSSTLEEGYQPKGNYLTEVPSEYITNEELGKKNYATKDELTEAISNAITESINNVLNAEY